MNRYNLKKQIYPLFAILSFIIILPIGMVFSSNSWMWLFVLAYWLLFLAFGYWRAFLSCLTGMAFLIIMVSGVTVLMTKDWKTCELSALRCAMISGLQSRNHVPFPTGSVAGYQEWIVPNRFPSLMHVHSILRTLK